MAEQSEDTSDDHVGQNGGGDLMDKLAARVMQEAQLKQRQEDSLQCDASNQMIPTCGNGSCVGILDSGSNIIAGPRAFVECLIQKIGVKDDCSNYHELPPISFMFGGKNVTLAKEGYIMNVSRPSFTMSREGRGMGGARNGEMLIEEEARQETGSGSHSSLWHMLEDFRDKHGIDLTMHLRNPIISEGRDAVHQRLSTQTHMCLPAFVPIDKQTEHGQLLIIGTPLLQTNYARWSWAPGDAAPQIFLKPLADCQTCKQAEATLGRQDAMFFSATPPTPMSPASAPPAPATLVTQSAPGAATGAKPALIQASYGGEMMRTEIQKERVVPQDIAQSVGPTIRSLDDIRFPHYALHIETL
jgi:hypothetical protein